jgi:hypothetical protein
MDAGKFTRSCPAQKLGQCFSREVLPPGNVDMTNQPLRRQRQGLLPKWQLAHKISA